MSPDDLMFTFIRTDAFGGVKEEPASDVLVSISLQYSYCRAAVTENRW
jgi:hypothetical protein